MVGSVSKAKNNSTKQDELCRIVTDGFHLNRDVKNNIAAQLVSAAKQLSNLPNRRANQPVVKLTFSRDTYTAQVNLSGRSSHFQGEGKDASVSAAFQSALKEAIDHKKATGKSKKHATTKARQSRGTRHVPEKPSIVLSAAAMEMTNAFVLQPDAETATERWLAGDHFPQLIS